MRRDLSQLQNTPLKYSRILGAFAAIAVGIYACFQGNQPLGFTVTGALLIVVPSFLCVARVLRNTNQFNENAMLVACRRLVAEKDMQKQIARVRKNFGSMDELRSGTVVKSL